MFNWEILMWLLKNYGSTLRWQFYSFLQFAQFKRKNKFQSCTP